ncbi:MAG: hypothetical protein ACI8P9_002074 [Parasphingorhabdus sp.]|jgi:hypothetical protein
MKSVLVIACGALAHELTQLKDLNGWGHVVLQCLPAELHNRPEKIAPAIESIILEKRGVFDQIVLGYADCGTGGGLDRLTEKYGITRIPGAHCYEFFAGSDVFQDLSERELGSFYLTDYLARNFQRLLVKGMGIDRFPELKEMLFGNYTRMVYLAQDESAPYEQQAKEAAEFLGLSYHRVDTGLNELNKPLSKMVMRANA